MDMKVSRKPLAERKNERPASVEVGVKVTEPKIRTAEYVITGTAPFVMNAFSQKAMQMMLDKMEAEVKPGTKKAPRKARNYQEDFEGSKHISAEGWIGIPASAIRSAMISACRLVNTKMTMAKMSIFVEHEGIDTVSGQPLVRMVSKPPRLVKHPVRNQTGVADIRVRAMFDEWSAKIRIMFDEDQFSISDVTNLLLRAGCQVGIGEGRPDSRESNGQGWGTFKVQMLQKQ